MTGCLSNSTSNMQSPESNIVHVTKCLEHSCRTLQVYFPVFLEGANLSMGDMHFSQGDGEVSFCGAIEMCAAFLTLK